MNLPRSLKDCICRSQASHPHWLVVEIESPERNGNIAVKHRYKKHDEYKILLNEFNRSVSNWQVAINIIKKKKRQTPVNAVRKLWFRCKRWRNFLTN